MARAQRRAGDVIAIFLFSMRPIIAHGLLKLKNTKSEERRIPFLAIRCSGILTYVSWAPIHAQYLAHIETLKAYWNCPHFLNTSSFQPVLWSRFEERLFLSTILVGLTHATKQIASPLLRLEFVSLFADDSPLLPPEASTMCRHLLLLAVLLSLLPSSASFSLLPSPAPAPPPYSFKHAAVLDDFTSGSFPDAVGPIRNVTMISDSTGVSAKLFLQRALAQFDSCFAENQQCEVRTRVFSHVTTEAKVAAIVKVAKAQDALVVYTLSVSEKEGRNERKK